MNLYGSQLWYNATSNSDKLAIKVRPDNLNTLIEIFENSDVNYFGYVNGKAAKISINRDDWDTLKEIVGENIAKALQVEDIQKIYNPPEMNVFGTIDYKYIPRKTKRYLTAESKFEQKALIRTAELLTKQGINFSGRVYDNKVTITIDEKDLSSATEIYNRVRANITKVSEQASKIRTDSNIARILECMAEQDFETEQIPDYMNLITELAHFDNIDFDDYVFRLNPKFTIEQNYKILEHLKDVYSNGGFDLLQPSEAEQKLAEIEKAFNLDLEIRTYLSKHSFDESQEKVIRDIVQKEQSIDTIFNEIDESFLPTEIEKLYSLYNDAIHSDNVSQSMQKINEFLESHWQNGSSTIEQADYTDAIFIDKDSQSVKWMYFNPDGNDGNGQYVTNEITYKELLLANEFTNTPEEFFDYISQTAEQYLSDFGTDYFERTQAEFLNLPDFTDCSADTVKGLVENALAADVKILGTKEMSAYLLERFANDSLIQDVYQNKETDFDNYVEQKIDEFIDSLLYNQTRIPGYSRFDTNTFCSEYKHSFYSAKIKEELVGTLTHDLNEAFSAIEQVQEQQEEKQELSEREKYFLDYENFIGRAVKNTLAYDEIEDLSYIFFEDGYIDKRTPFEKATYGYSENRLTQPEMFELVRQFKNGEDISERLVSALMVEGKSFNLDYNHLDIEYDVKKTENGYSFVYGNAERSFTVSELAEGYINRLKNEHDDIIKSRTIEDLTDNIPDLTDETAEQLLNAFNDSVVSDWKGDEVKENQIKDSLRSILGDDDKTEKAFASISDMAYNYKPVPKAEEKSEIENAADKTENESGIHFGLFGNGITAYDTTKRDKETNDYPIVAHISPEGTVKFYVDDIADSDRDLINAEADKQREDFTEQWNNLSIDKRYQEIFDRANMAEFSVMSKDKLPREDFVKKYEKSIIFKSEDFPKAEPEHLQGTYKIYQLPSGDEYHGIRFESKEVLEQDGIQLNHDDYSFIYEGDLSEFNQNNLLEAIYTKFNTEQMPTDFTGHSLSVSDVIVTEINGEQRAYYCDSIGFTEMPEFFLEKELAKEKLSPTVSDLSAGKEIHQVVTNAGLDGGIDDKQEYATLDEAITAGREYLADDYLGFSVINKETHIIEHTEGDFPLEQAFSPEILRNNGLSELAEEAQTAQEETSDKEPEPSRELSVGDKFLYRDKEYTVTSMSGIYPDDVGISYTDKLSNGAEYEVTENIDAFKLMREGQYLGNVYEQEQSENEPEKDIQAENSVPFTITVTTVTILESEHPEIIENHTYTLAEFDELVDRLNFDWASNRQREIKEYGSIDAAYEFGKYQTVADTDFVINLPNGEKISESLKIGSFYGGLIDYLKDFTKYEELIPQFEKVIDEELTKRNSVIEQLTFDSIPDEHLEVKNEPITEEVEQPEIAEIKEDLQTDMEEISDTNVTEVMDNSENEVNIIDDSSTEVKEDSQSDISETFDADVTEVENISSNVEKSQPKEENQTTEQPEYSEPVSEQTPTEEKFDIHKIDYHIADEHIGEGKKSERFKNNIAAIKTLKEIESENRLATPEEQEILAKYVGWGGLADCFKEKHPSYNQLRHYLTEEEFNAARASTLTAFYTPPVVMQSMYKALGNMGFKNGEILEPACGIGNFIGTIPDEMKNSKVHAVELDSLSGRIAKQLYQNADIKITGFEKTKFNDNFFDVAVGNVPFGDISVKDKQYDKYNWRIHNYFFAKSLDKVRPGGVAAFVTSRYTLDSKSSSFREYLSDRADLLGAIRLPNNTFSKAAGTDVTSDIIFLQKRDTPPEITPDWVKTAENKNGFTINQYFVDNPDMILGNLTETRSQFGRPDITVEPVEGAELSEQLDKAIQNIKGTIPERKPEERTNEVETKIVENNDVPEDLRNFSFYENGDGKICFKEKDEGTVWKKGADSKSYTDRAKAFIAVRDCTREVLNAMVNDCTDEELTALQGKLNTLYDDFYKKYGLVHSKFNKSIFSDDISYQLVASLESKYNEKELLEKSDLFTKRTIRPPELITCVDTAQEALTISIAEKGRVDLDFMSELYECDKDTMIKELEGKIFPVPELSTNDEIVYQDSSEYLSGDIREKIENAKAAAEHNPMLYSANIKALEDVLPTPLKAGDIDVKIGASWIDPKYYQQFMYETFNTPSEKRADVETPWYRRAKSKIELTYSEAGNSYHIDNKSSDTSLFSTKTFGLKTSRANAYFIFENLLNLRETKIYKTVTDIYGDDKRVIDVEKTKLAENKAENIKKAFKEWIFKDPERRETLVKKYNDLYNSIRPREFDGSGLTFPGMNAEINLRPHQKNAIAHALYGGNTLFAHSVGAGKTFEMIATAMESKRLGLCSKSLMVVPNHLTEQIGDDFQKLYPNANILVATKDDFTKQKRRYLVSRIATGDYDAVIIGHSQLGRIPLSKEKQSEYIQNEIDELVQAISEMKSAEERSFSVKDAEKRKINLEKQLEKLQTEKDDIVTFEELGIDKIFVDEAHEFKNLYTPTKLNNVSGVSHTASQKASDLYMKCRYLDEKTDGRGVTFATGTPISNSVTELYTMQRYLQHDLLKSRNLSHFDQWITLFGEQVTDHQIDPTGKKYKPKTRISNYSNMSELMSMFKCTADIKTAEMMNLDVPKCELIIENVPPTELQQELVQELSDRADLVERGSVEPTEDNFLKITSDGRKVGLDPRLINPELEDNPETKLNRCVRNVLQIHKETEKDKLTQLIFCDLGVPNGKNSGTSEKADNTENVSIAEQESFEDTGNFCIYDDIKKKLIEGGVPENEIAFIHDAKTDKAKSELFEKCRKGEVRVLLGSTPKMGTGTNIQDKLVALHDLDVPWRPADLEQRLGRMVRQGNQNKNVKLFRYVTTGTFDAYSYQTLENKQRYISQIYKGDQRTCQDVDQQSLSYAEIKTLCTGDERLKELMTLDTEVSNLSALKREHTNTVYEMQDKIKNLAEDKIYLENSIAGVEKDIEICSTLPKDKETGGIAFKLTIGNTTFTDKTEAAKALQSEFKIAMPKLEKGETVTIGTMHGFPITVKYASGSQDFRATINGTAKYTVPFSEVSQPTNIKRFCNEFDGMKTTLSNKKERLVRLNAEVKEAEKILNTPFERQDELQAKTNRRNSLKLELQAEQKEKASQKQESKTFHFSIAERRKNAQKSREQSSKEKSKDKNKDKGAIS